MKKIAWVTAVVLATLIGVYMLYEFREAVILFMLSLGVAAAARHLVDRFTAARLPRALGLVVVYLSIIGFLFVIIAVFGGSLLSELEQLSDNFAVFYENLWSTWPQGTEIQRTIIKYLPAPPDLYAAIAGADGGGIFQTFLGFTVGSLTFISQVGAVLIFSIYWSTDQVHFERLWLSLLPVEQRSRAREIWRNIETGVGAYIRSELTQSILVGILLGYGFWLMQIEYPALLAIFCAIAWLIPWIGGVVSILPVFWAGWMVSPWIAVLAAVYTVAVLLFLELIVEPRMYNRRQYSSLLTVLLVIALADVVGLIGLLLAPPLAAAIQILFNQLVAVPKPAPALDSAVNIDRLEERLAAARLLAAERDAELPPKTASMLSRLDTLIKQAGELLSD